MFVSDRDVVFGQVGGFAPGVATAGDDRLESAAHGPLSRGPDAPGLVDVNPQGALLSNDGEHGLPGRYVFEAFLGDFLGLGIGGGLGEEGVDFSQLAIPVSDLVFKRRARILSRRLRGRVEGETGPLDVQGDGFLNRKVFDGPSVELNEAAEAGDGPSAGDDMSVGVAVGAGYGDEFAVWVNGDPGADIGRIFADFGGVAGGSKGIDFEQSQHGGGSNQSGEDSLAFQFNDGVGLVGEAGSDFFDATVANEDGGVGQDGTRGREDPAVLQEEAGCLGRQ